MRTMRNASLVSGIVGAVSLLLCAPAQAQIRFTEWMYNGTSGEYAEFTNIGNSPIDLTGWSYDDNSRQPGSFDLSSFGVVAPGETVVITEETEATFRANWSIPLAIRILGGVSHNLARNDEINLFNGSTLVDRLTFGDQDFPGTIRTQNTSGWTGPAGLGLNNVALWQLSVVGDAAGSYASAQGNIGNPGLYPLLNAGATAPEPGAGILALMGLSLFALRRRMK